MQSQLVLTKFGIFILIVHLYINQGKFILNSIFVTGQDKKLINLKDKIFNLKSSFWSAKTISKNRFIIFFFVKYKFQYCSKI